MDREVGEKVRCRIVYQIISRSVRWDKRSESHHSSRLCHCGAPINNPLAQSLTAHGVCLLLLSVGLASLVPPYFSFRGAKGDETRLAAPAAAASTSPTTTTAASAAGTTSAAAAACAAASALAGRRHQGGTKLIQRSAHDHDHAEQGRG